ncbi:hypothetical protein F0562_034906 [Nyssa sinensis]|uniref:Armadillo repeat-containing domain-containing protein n=1 Tax=Nyssa sinensis TaxID=561372 RepID=A0A5J5AAQ0_9ASTE|nr:hypothetical protein F0562_034906 [Nyssa sinensis]
MRLYSLDAGSIIHALTDAGSALPLRLTSRSDLVPKHELTEQLTMHGSIIHVLFASSSCFHKYIGLILFLPLKQEAVEILASLWEASKYSELQGYQGLRELQSQHNVSLFLQLITDSDPQIKVQFLQLLVLLSSKSETVQNLVQSDKDATAHLFSYLDNDQPMVRRCAMKLIYYISNGHPVGVPLAPSPAKRNVITTLAAILTNSPDAEDRSAAAGIISQLPADDITIDKILCKSEALKAIHEVSKLDPYPLQIRILSKGTSLAKQRTATTLANLSMSTSNKPPSYSSITAGISSDFPFGDY